MDGTTAMWYVNKQGGVGSSNRCREALHLWSWAGKNQVFQVASHLAGVLNVRADSLSRLLKPDHKWHLHPEVVSDIFQMWGTPEVDFFAT